MRQQVCGALKNPVKLEVCSVTRVKSKYNKYTEKNIFNTLFYAQEAFKGYIFIFNKVAPLLKHFNLKFLT